MEEALPSRITLTNRVAPPLSTDGTDIQESIDHDYGTDSDPLMATLSWDSEFAIMSGPRAPNEPYSLLPVRGAPCYVNLVHLLTLESFYRRWYAIQLHPRNWSISPILRKYSTAKYFLRPRCQSAPGNTIRSWRRMPRISLRCISNN